MIIKIGMANDMARSLGSRFVSSGSLQCFGTFTKRLFLEPWVVGSLGLRQVGSGDPQ